MKLITALYLVLLIAISHRLRAALQHQRQAGSYGLALRSDKDHAYRPELERGRLLDGWGATGFAGQRPKDVSNTERVHIYQDGWVGGENDDGATTGSEEVKLCANTDLQKNLAIIAMVVG